MGAERPCWSYEYYDVTAERFYIDSHPDFDHPDSTYPGNQSKCFVIFTKTPGHYIRVEEIRFRLQYSYYCQADHVALYNSDGLSDLMDKYCGTQGPDIQFSSGTSLTIHFVSYNHTGIYKGFRFYVSDSDRSDDPLSTAAFTAIVLFSILGLTILLAVMFAGIEMYNPCGLCRTKGATNNSSSDMHGLPTYDDVTSSTDRYPIRETGRENNVDGKQAFDNIACEELPPTYEEDVEMNSSVQTIRGTQNNQSNTMLQASQSGESQSEESTQTAQSASSETAEVFV